MSASSSSPATREFSCQYCNGRIVIPRDLPPTTAPCPLCGKSITSPALEDSPFAEAAAPAPAVPQEAAAASSPAPAVVEAGPSAAPEAAASAPPVPSAAPLSAPWKKFRKAELYSIAAVLGLVLFGGGFLLLRTAKSLETGSPQAKPDGAAKVVPAPVSDSAFVEATYLRIGWEQDARKVLQSFLTATSVSEMLPYVLHGDRLAERMEALYQPGHINEGDTPAEAFSAGELSLEDKKRGLFLMLYDRPAQFDIKEFFRPLASIEVQYGVEEAGPLLGFLGNAANFAMEPVRAQAFFKRTPEGLKLDWEIFVQTKYRTLRQFTESPEAGKREVFRVLLMEDVPMKGEGKPGTRTYRVFDSANERDSVRINVAVDSEVGRAVSVLNWRGTTENRRNLRTATVELGWSGDASQPVLEITRFLCWEFLGLGGEESSPE